MKKIKHSVVPIPRQVVQYIFASHIVYLYATGCLILVILVDRKFLFSQLVCDSIMADYFSDDLRSVSFRLFSYVCL